MSWIKLAFAALLLLAPAAAPALAAPETVGVATLRITANAPLFIADAKGYFRDEGLAVDFHYFDAAQDSVLAVMSGSVQFGSGGLTAGFYNLAAKGGLRIIAAQSREERGFQNNAFVVTNAAYDKGLTGLKDLPGHRVGINTSGSTQHYALGLIAKKYGFDLSKVSIVPLQSYPNLVAAFKGGQIDAMVATVSITREMERQKVGRVIGWSGDETPWQLGAIYVRPRLIAEQRPLIEKFLRAWTRAATDYNTAFNQLDKNGAPIKGPGYDELLAILVKAVQQPVEQVRDGLPYIDANARLDIGDIYAQIAFWKQQHLLDPSADPKQILDLSFIKGHYNVLAE